MGTMLRPREVLSLTLAFAALSCAEDPPPAPPSATPDAGPTTGDGGCTMQSEGPRSGRRFVSAPREGAPGAVVWASPEGAGAPDGVFARAALTAGGESEELRVTDFGFALPEGASFRGVEVILDRRAEGAIVDGAITLVGIAQTSGRGKRVATPWPDDIVGTHHYGQATDTWAFDLEAPDVERSEFGVALWVKRGDGDAGAATALVDGLRVRVSYCR